MQIKAGVKLGTTFQLQSGFSLSFVCYQSYIHLSATLEGSTGQPGEQDGEPLPDGKIVEGTPIEGRCAY